MTVTQTQMQSAATGPGPARPSVLVILDTRAGALRCHHPAAHRPPGPGHLGVSGPVTARDAVLSFSPGGVL
jgi:hypothetical protein